MPWITNKHFDVKLVCFRSSNHFFFTTQAVLITAAVIFSFLVLIYITTFDINNESKRPMQCKLYIPSFNLEKREGNSNNVPVK